MFLSRHSGRDEDAQMTDRLVDRIDNGLAIAADLVNVVVKVEDPIKGLLRRRYVVTLGAKHYDRRANIAKINCRAVRGLDLSGRQFVANEQLVSDELHLLGVQVDMTAPPALEA